MRTNKTRVGCYCGWRGKRVRGKCDCYDEWSMSCACAWGFCPKCSSRIQTMESIKSGKAAAMWPLQNNSQGQRRLKESLDYEPSTGRFTWRFNQPHRAVGDEAGCIDREGYRIIGVGGNQYKAHRLAFLYMTGRWPVGEIDHANGDRADNRWPNLREATHSQNAHNARKPSHNTSGVKGVHLYKATGQFTARVQHNEISYFLGYFTSKDEAAQAVMAKRVQLHQEFARHD